MTSGSYQIGKEKLGYVWQSRIALYLKLPPCNKFVCVPHIEKQRLQIWKVLKVDKMLYSHSFP